VVFPIGHLTIVAMAFMFTPPGFAPGRWAGGGPVDPASLVTMEIDGDVAVAGPGQTFLLGVHLTIAPEWHIYWKSPGDSGAPTVVDVSAPEGWTIGPTLYPRPARFTSPSGSVTWGYEEDVVLLVPVTAPVAVDSSPASLDVLVTWLACKDVCHMGDAQQEFPVAHGGTPGATTNRFAQWKRRIPKPIADLPQVTVTATAEGVTIAGTFLNAEAADLIPITTPGVEVGSISSIASGSELEMAISLTTNEDNAMGDGLRFRCLLATGGDPDGPSWEIDVELPSPRDTDATGGVQPRHTSGD
jgi:DsbC/DsbD-like thiol-disulfide interchange protein